MRVWKAGGEIRGWDHGLAVARALRGGDEAAMRVRAVSEERGDAQQARGRTGRSGELALGCEWRAARGKGRERGAGWALLGQARERGSWVELGWTDRGSGLGQGEWCWAVAWGLDRNVKELAREGKRENGPQWMFLGRTGFGLETGLGCLCWVCWDLRFGPLLLFFFKPHNLFEFKFKFEFNPDTQPK